MDQEARKKALASVTKGKVNLLITTDVTARGIDIPILDNVIHYDFPATAKLFIHRSGRAARAGRTGRCYSLVSSPDIPYLIDTFLQIGGRDEKSLGSIPEEVLRSEQEEIKFLLSQVDNSEYLKRAQTVKNSIKKYYKTRPSASIESFRRSKEFFYGVHPSYASENPELTEFTEKLKEFRPVYNILELHAKMSGHDEAAEIMKQKRLKLKKTKSLSNFEAVNDDEISKMENIAKTIHTTLENVNKRKRGQLGSYRSQEFVDYTGQKIFEKGKEFSQLTLEMPMDDELGLRKKDKMI